MVNVIIQEITDSGNVVSIPSLVFTSTLDIEKAQKLCAFHIYHLHRNDQQHLPNVDSVAVEKNTVIVNEHTVITFGNIAMIDVEQKQRIGKLGLFGYNKTLKRVSRPLLAC